VYRADVVTSGRITPTMPDPAVVTLVSWAIAEKLASNELTLSPDAAADAEAEAEAEADSEAGADVAGAGVAVAAWVAVGDGEPPDDEQPATIAAMAIMDVASLVVLITPQLLFRESARRRQPARLIWPSNPGHGRGDGGLPLKDL
jgi:hypothetical protein